MSIPLLEREVPDRDAMHALGRELAGVLRAGDLVLLSGELGAGKTTLAQGIGEGLHVRGPITSPTFVLARVHPSLGSGPDLVHVDAFRLAGLPEVDDLDLDASLEDAVTLVEWGEGKADGLAEDRLVVRIVRTLGGQGGEDEPRTVTVTALGPRWSRSVGGAVGAAPAQAAPPHAMPGPGSGSGS
jgi:tRNA threonylcarbamoyladenosine biosynthesis protein TsaE